MAPRFNINSRTIAAPIAAFFMASILFVYTRTSIHAAKRNAKAHREADGGQINWGNESLRRHGVLEPPEDQNVVRQLLLGGKPGAANQGRVVGKENGIGGRGQEEGRIRAAVAEAKAKREREWGEDGG